ncbi:MAG TPA: zinc-dependent metalloprotease [Flavitalea sp.]|nr:zinc-dependent metalloprotease [Flavitalea sp.]
MSAISLHCKTPLFLFLLSCFFYSGFAQVKKTDTSATTKPAAAAAKPDQKTAPKPYKEVVTDKTITQKGLFTIHSRDEKWFLELGDSLLGKDILIVNRIARAPANIRAGSFGYAGDEINKHVIRFEKGPNHKIFLRDISYSVYSGDSTRPMYRSVMNSNIQPIAAAFDIKAYSPDSAGSVIELTDFIASDNDLLFFAPSLKSALRLGSSQKDKSYVVSVRTYPINTEIRTVKTYSRASSPSSSSAGSPPPSMAPGYATYELNTSMVLLPEAQMRPRYFDNRVAYFTTEYTDFDANPQGVKDVSIITRWRLEPRPEDREKLEKGELVEPVKPIVFYIDPATPEKWVPYLIQGVNDWQKAFEKAGFKNAIYARKAPDPREDSTWSLEDARFSAIVYKPSEIANASGPHIHDPRSGEILESHINWYHNVMSLLRKWYMIQAGAIDPRARKPEFDDELMGQLIRFVSSHEVGHTLGLPHNMGASSATPVEKLRDKKWLEKHGHTASIMDYARFNYVGQPEDGLSEKEIFPRIGDYDEWAIEWGYRPLPGKTREEEKLFLNELVKKNAANPRLRFLHSNSIDPRAQTEDLGDNAMKAGEYGLRNLKRILPQLPGWLNKKAEGFEDLSATYNELVTQYSRYMGHVITNIGGIYTDNKTTDQQGAVYAVVPKTAQKQALSFLHKNLFETPYWLLDRKVLDLISQPNSDRISTIQDNFLGNLLTASRLQRLISSANRDKQAYPLEEYMEDLRKGIWQELSTHKPIDNYRRNLQKSYIERLGAMIKPASANSPATRGISITITIGPVIDPYKSDIISIMKAELRSVRSAVNAALPSYANQRVVRYHLMDIVERIDKILKVD